MEIYCDNLSAVHLTANLVLHRKSKHFATHYHFARERVADGSLIVKHIPATQQLADIFTKSLPQHSFCSLRIKLGVDNLTTSSLSGSIGLSRPAPHIQAQPSVKPTSAFTTTRQNSATVTKGVKAQNRGKQEDKRCTFVTAHQVALGNRFEALRDQDV